MKRLATNRQWWTRRVGGYTLLCFEVWQSAGALLAPTPVTRETIIGRPTKVQR